MKPAFIRTFELLIGIFLIGMVLSGCHKKKERETTKAPATLKTLHDSGKNLAREIEIMTEGAHARIIWEQSQNPRKPDTFSTGDEQILKGFDTRDGLGEHAILKEQGNYTRPLLSTDGQTILFTRQSSNRKDKLWVHQADIYRTDWKGATPVKLATGLAVDCWRDPSTQVEWVYAVQDWPASSKDNSSSPRSLVRFPLMHPEKIEPVYDDTQLDSENIQFSRDGRRASGGFPWPNAGIFILDGNTVRTQKLRNGCWPSYAPDNSHVSWVFNGSHRSATFFAGDGAKSWEVDFNPPDTGHREMFHPRWSNHPRYFAITGPYKSSKGGNAIMRGGGRSAEIYLGRFNTALDKVEAWVEITDNDLGDNYPDLWIEGGDKAQLSGFGGSLGIASKPAESAAVWPAKMDGIMFLWRNMSAQNTWRTPDGRNHTAELENHGASRFGRLFEMLPGGGQVDVQEDTAREAIQHLRDQGDASFEALVLPGISKASGNPPAQSPSFLFRGPNFCVGMRDGHLVLDQNNGKSRTSITPLPVKPFHLVVTRKADALEALVNGARLKFGSPHVVPPETSQDSLIFGGGWDGGLLNIALYGRAIEIEEAVKNSATLLREAEKFPSAPPQVKLKARLVESSPLPALEDIRPYTGSLVALVYEVEQVLSGDYKDKRILVKHWGLLNKQAVAGFPREVEKSYQIVVEKEANHPELKGERTSDETTALDLEPWFDVTQPRVISQP